MHKKIVYVYLAYACDIAGKYFIGHAALEERTSALKAHSHSRPFKQTILSNECRELLTIFIERSLMVPSSEVYYSKLLGFQATYSIDHLSNVGDRPTFEWTSSRIQSNKVESEAPLLRCSLRCRLRHKMNLTPL